MITFTLRNDTSDTIFYGSEIILEECINGEWYKVPYEGDFVIFMWLAPLDAHNEHITRTQISDWVPLSQDESEYRIIKEVLLSEDSPTVSYPICANLLIP